jgi:hypothetical protein
MIGRPDAHHEVTKITKTRLQGALLLVVYAAYVAAHVVVR